MVGSFELYVLAMLVGWFGCTFVAILFATVVMRTKLSLSNVALLSFVYVLWPVTGPFTFIVFTGLYANKALSQYIDDESVRVTQRAEDEAALAKLNVPSSR